MKTIFDKLINHKNLKISLFLLVKNLTFQKILKFKFYALPTGNSILYKIATLKFLFLNFLVVKSIGKTQKPDFLLVKIKNLTF